MARVTIQITEISLTDWHGEQQDVVDYESDPLLQYIRAIEELAVLLDCSEEEAERYLLSKQ